MGHCLTRLDRERSRSLPFIGVVNPDIGGQNPFKNRTNSMASQNEIAVKKSSLPRLLDAKVRKFTNPATFQRRLSSLTQHREGPSCTSGADEQRVPRITLPADA